MSATAGDPPQVDRLIGQMVGRYRVERRIGEGGMGCVYEAVQPAIGSRVAIKVLTRDVAANPSVVQRFFDEARSVNLIRHENIVNVLDLATLPDGRPFILMELLDGQPLSARIAAQGTLEASEVVRLAAQVLDALGAAHALGIVHRDIKPDNIFVTRGGQAKVLDFGVAKLLPEGAPGEARAATSTGVVGTPQYMAPEQAAGGRIDPRTDLYALGLVIYEALSGKPAFEGQSLYELIRLQVEVMPPPLHARLPDLPAALESAVARALAKAPAARWPDAAAMRTALEQAVEPAAGSAAEQRAPAAALAQANTMVAGADQPGELLVAAHGRSPSAREAAAGGEPGTPPAAAPASGGGGTASTLRGLEGGASTGRSSPTGLRGSLVVAAILAALGGLVAAWWVLLGREALQDDAARQRVVGEASASRAGSTAGGAERPRPARGAATPAPSTASLEPGFARARFDPVAYAPLALAHARELAPDVALAALHAAPVGEAGLVDVTVPEAQMRYQFASPQGEICVRVIVGAQGVSVSRLSGACDPPVTTRLPRCTLPHAVAKASFGMRLVPGWQGAASYQAVKGEPHWRVRVDEHLTREVPDDC